MQPHEPIARAWSFECAIQDGCARARREFDYGTALFDDNLRRVYDANFVRFERGFDELTGDIVEAAADGLQAGLAHRKVMIPDEAAGARVAAELQARGWRYFTLATMAYHGPRTRDPAAAARAEQVAPEELHAARVRSLTTREADAVHQIVEFTETMAQTAPTRLLAARAGPDEEIGSFCALFQSGDIAQIDEVVTIKRHRRQGLGNAVVERALQTSLADGDELTFLVADEGDWPREWYARLGFEPIGRRYELLRS
jgi:ribosomal protein S18 acetylase RimI-like enzyme